MSMDLMLREGLINVLIKELDLYLTSDDEFYKKKREEKLQTSKKRKLPEIVNETKCKVNIKERNVIKINEFNLYSVS